MSADLPTILFVAFWVVWLLCAIKPRDKQTWWLENMEVLVVLSLVIWSYFERRLSDLSYVIIFIMIVLHVAAARYSYEKTPWGDWLSKKLGWKRNNFDRILHFLYGLLMVFVLNDVLGTSVPDFGFLRGIIIFSIIVALGSLFELLEYGAAAVLHKSGNLAFLGFQGDVWDTQKDIIMQVVGSILGLIILGLTL